MLGGAGCGAKRVASGWDRRPSRAGVCCSRAVAVQSLEPDLGFIRDASRKLLDLEIANRQGSHGGLGAMLADQLQFFKESSASREEALTKIDATIAQHPDFWVLLDACDVSAQVAAGTWTAVCR